MRYKKRDEPMTETPIPNIGRFESIEGFIQGKDGKLYARQSHRSKILDNMFHRGDRVTSNLWSDTATFIKYVPDGECDCIVIRDDSPDYEYPAFSWELILVKGLKDD
jgi:hypothetical protein